MSQYAKPGEAYTAILELGITGQMGVVAYTLIDPAIPNSPPGANVVIARSTAGITEPALGTYIVEKVAPTADFGATYVQVWDAGDPDDPEETWTDTLELVEHLPEELDFPGNYVPTLDDVASLIRARTVDVNGNELGTFTPTTTRPTDDQVSNLVGQAVRDVGAIVGETVPEKIRPEVARVAAIRAAMLVELSFFPSQIGTPRSQYAMLKDLWEEAVGTPGKPGRLVYAVSQATDDSVDLAGTGRVKYNFPPRDKRIGMNTIW
jgi:hypothetical protein